MKYAVVTGTSKGLGEALAKLLLEKNVHVIGIARNYNEKLNQIADKHAVTYQHQSCDLSNVADMEKVFKSIREQVFNPHVELVYLINNAAVVGPIDKSGMHSSSELTAHVNLNLLAPMIATNLFLEQSEQASIPLVIANVTSGAANRSVFGWSAYCSTKAGLDRFTQTVAIEQDEQKTKNKVVLFDPSIMDTEMQQQIRSSSEAAFKDVQQFKQYKKDNSLRETNVVAATFVGILTSFETIENGKTYRMKELM